MRPVLQGFPSPEVRRPFPWVRRVATVLGGLLLAGGLCLAPAQPLPHPPTDHPSVSAEPFEAYLERQLQRSRREGVLPGNEERLSRSTALPAPVVILYVHGFGASRAEGEAVVDPLAAELGATVYYTRLPGHGGSMAAQAAALGLSLSTGCAG